MNYANLAIELAKAEYAGMTPTQAFAAVKIKTVQSPVVVNGGDIRATLYDSGSWTNIIKRANASRNGTDTSDVAATCQQIYDLAANGGTINMGNAPTSQKVIADVTALVQAGIISQDEGLALLALGSKIVSLLSTIDCDGLQSMDDISGAYHCNVAIGGA